MAYAWAAYLGWGLALAPKALSKSATSPWPIHVLGIVAAAAVVTWGAVGLRKVLRGPESARETVQA
jgi:hypothetical protein